MMRLQPNRAGELAALIRRGEESIVLEPGDYVVEPLLVRSALALKGAGGAAQTRLRAAGGALFRIFDGSGATLEGITLQGGINAAGGAVQIANAVAVKLDGCVLEGNVADQFRGGAVSVEGEARVELVRCVLRGNRCERGGALAVGDDARALVDRCLFVENHATLGGALWASDRAALTVKSSTFVQNEAEHAQGGNALFATGSRGEGPRVTLVNAVLSERRALVNNPERRASVSASHCIVPDLGIGVDDAGGNLLVQADLVEVAPGLWALRAGAPGSSAADPGEITADAVDFLGRPLRQAMGALAAG